MTDKPIIFSGPMVRAILEGHKTQTRRVLKPQPINDGFWRDKPRPQPCGWTQEQWDRIYSGAFPDGFKCAQSFPYAPGDRLWVRETWAPESVDAEEGRYGPDYQATANGQPVEGRWRPSIHMPRWASRLTLIVEDVRVQRLNEISARDSIAEGVECQTCKAMLRSACGGKGCFASMVAFRDLWDSLNAKRGYGWDTNPWVVALTFRPIHRNIDALQSEAAE